MPIEIPFLANVSGFLRGSKDVERGLDDVADSLDDLVRDTARTGRSLGDDLSDGADKGERGIDALNRSFRELATEARSETAKAGDDIGRNMRRGADDASDGVKEIGRESASTAKEAAASFDGSAQSIGDAFQEVAANAFAGFGPAGLIAGVAAAAGIGVVFSKMEEGEEQTEAFREQVSQLASELIDTKRSGPSLDYLVGRLKELATETGDGATNLGKLNEIADRAGQPFDKLAQAYAGSNDELDELIRQNDKHLKQLEDEAASIDTTTNAGIKRYEAIQQQIVGQEQYNQYLNEGKRVADEAAQAQENYAASGAEEIEARNAALAEYQELMEGAADAVTDALDPLAIYNDALEQQKAAEQERAQAVADATASTTDSWEDFANTVSLSTEQYLAELEKQVAANENWAANMTRVTETHGDDVAAIFAAMGPEGQQLLQQALDTWTDTDWSRFMEAHKRNGEAGGRLAALGIESQIPDYMDGPRIGVTADLSAYERDMWNAINKQRVATIQVRAVMPDLNGAVSGSGRMGVP